MAVTDGLSPSKKPFMPTTSRNTRPARAIFAQWLLAERCPKYAPPSKNLSIITALPIPCGVLDPGQQKIG